MPDEIDLLRRFRADTPGPDDAAWSRARTALAHARAGEPGAAAEIEQVGKVKRPVGFSGDGFDRFAQQRRKFAATVRPVRGIRARGAHQVQARSIQQGAAVDVGALLGCVGSGHMSEVSHAPPPAW